MDFRVITKAQNFRLQKFKIKTMLITFFVKQGVIHKEFVSEGQTVDSDFYVDVIERLLKRISRVRPQFRAEQLVLVALQCPAQSALVVKIFLAVLWRQATHPILLIWHQRVFFSFLR
jgi:hypothetical protein